MALGIKVKRGGLSVRGHVWRAVVLGLFSWRCLGATTGLEFAQSTSEPSNANSSTQEGVDAPPNPDPPPDPAPPPFVVVGRVTWPDPADAGHFISAWSGTTVGVRFNGTGLVVRMADTDRLPFGPPAGGWAGLSNAWDVSVDGIKQTSPLIVERVPGDVVVVKGLSADAHEVWLTRQTEAPNIGRAELYGVRALDGRLLPPPTPRQRRIEVVGTSVETGFYVGATADDPNVTNASGCPYNPRAVNQNLAWPKLLAEDLGAELVNSSVQGAGILIGFTEWGGPGVQLPGFYKQADLFLPATTWNHAKAPMDLILLVAGWSDVGNVDLSDSATASRLQAAYHDFLGEIRALQPSAFIYAVIRSSDSPYFQRAAMASLIQAAVDSRKDPQIVTLTLPAWSMATSNCSDHPSWAQHRALAAAARAQVHHDLGW